MENNNQQYTKISFIPKDPGVFTKEQVNVINEIMSNESTGTIDLTLDLPLSIMVPSSSEEVVKEKLKSVDLLVVPRGSCIKEIKVCPKCNHGVGSYREFGRKLNEEIMGNEAPSAIRMSVSGCGCRCGMPMLQDIGIVAGLGGYSLYIGGNPYGKPTIGEKIAVDVPENEIIPAINGILSVFADKKDGKKHLYEVVKKVGIEPFKEAVEYVRKDIK